jgi:small-conductance mechanosensitive channel
MDPEFEAYKKRDSRRSLRILWAFALTLVGVAVVSGYVATWYGYVAGIVAFVVGFGVVYLLFRSALLSVMMIQGPYEPPSTKDGEG